MPKNARLTPLALATLLSLSSPLWAQDAEILHLQGPGDRRATEAQSWEAAQARQQVAPGGFVRTREAARMALLLADQTQIRLNQNTVLQVKAVANQGNTTRLSLGQGRAWAQTRNVGAGGPLTVDTPAATAAIRGTDWELDVGPDGRTQLTVLSGTVTLSNALGSLDVGRNEAAIAEVGKAPVRLQLSNPRERVQWVQALTAQPLRHLDGSAVPARLQNAWQALQRGDSAALQAALGTETNAWADVLRAADHTQAGRVAQANEALRRALIDPQAPAAAHLLLADLQLVNGEADAAGRTLEAGLARHPNDPDLLALLARTQLLTDQVDQAQATLQRPRRNDSTSHWLAQGDLARRQGAVAGTLSAFERASQTAPTDPRGWQALGSAQGEREDLAQARAALAKALSLDRQSPGAVGELATVEAQANRLAQAEQLFHEALQANPGDYVAQTGLGLLRLKQGRTAEALDALLRAGVMEPRYSRAASYTAVAYHQLGRHTDARAALQRAIELDHKDPVPHLLLAQIHTDLFEADDAVQAARAAVARLPFLKSLNQVANNQQGSANFGASLAFFGLEDWALELAHQSDYPYWGGSHLFLADRYAGEFNKNSRLFQGFLTDPLAFGASPGFSSLLQRAGAYGTVGVNIDHEFGRLQSPYAAANGLFNGRFPVALFGKLQTVEGERFPIDVGVSGLPAFFDPTGTADLHAKVGTLGLGLQPTEQLNLFLYGNRFDVALRGHNQVLDFEGLSSGSDFDHRFGQGVLGASWKWSPTAQSWLKLGRSSERTDLRNYPVAFSEQDFFGVLGFFANPTKRLSDVQLRHTLEWSERSRVTLGVETGRESQRSEAFALGPVYATQGGQTTSDVLAFGGTNHIERRLQVLHAGWQHQLDSAWRIDTALAHNRLRERTQGQNSTFLLGNDVGGTEEVNVDQTRRTWTPRVGVAWVPSPGLSLRMAYQDWQRPISVNTLAPVETAGLAVDDRLVQAGGRSRSTTVQLGYSPDERSFVLLRADTQRVHNPGTLGVDLRTPSLPFLNELRNQQLDNLSANDILEDDPDFEQGRLHRLSLGASRMLGRQWSAYGRWVRALGRSSLSGGEQTLTGLRIPYVPRDTLVLGATWSGGQRMYLSGRMVWRGKRFEDDRNLTALPSGWGMDLMGLWESPDKRWLVGVAALNLFAPKSARTTQRYVVDARLRF